MRLILAIMLFSSISHAQLRIAVIDSGYNKLYGEAPLCPGAKPHTDSNPTFHGTNVANLIARNAGSSGYCLYPISVYNPKFNNEGYLAILEQLTHMHIDILNLSMSGKESWPEEQELLRVLLDQGVTIFAAAGNDNGLLYDDICNIYPACSDDRIIVISTYDDSSGQGTRVSFKTQREKGCTGGICLSGTSQATAIETGRFVRFLLRHK